MSKSGRQREESWSAHKTLRTTKTPCNSAANSLDINASLDLDNIAVEKDVLSPMMTAQYVVETTQLGGEACPVKRLPDSVMLEILGYLSVRDLCRAACVCRGWNHLVREKPLWKRVDLSPFKISLVELRKLVFAFFSDSLQSLSLRGYLKSVKNTECLSDSLLKELGKRSPNLEELSFLEADLSKASSANLPPKLQTLKLISCNYPTFWLMEAFKQSNLNSVQHLEMTRSNGFGVRDLESLTPKPFTSLLSLKLSKCYRVGHRGACRIADNCPNLRELDLSGMALSNEALEKIGSNLTQLRKLKLCEVTNSDGVLLDVHHLSPLKLLEELSLTHPEAQPDSDLYSGNVLVGLVHALPALKMLAVTKNEMTEAHVRKMKNACIMPHSECDSDSVLRVGFFSLSKIAAGQSGR